MFCLWRARTRDGAAPSYHVGLVLSASRLSEPALHGGFANLDTFWNQRGTRRTLDFAHCAKCSEIQATPLKLDITCSICRPIEKTSVV